MWIFKDGAVDTFKFRGTAQALREVGQLVPGKCWSIGSVQEPPGSREHGSESDVTTNSAVSEQQPVGDQNVVGASWFFVHDIQIRWVEGESGGWETIGDQVDPEELDWDEGFWDAEGGGKEDADDFTDVGGNQVSDKLFHVVVDGSTFADRSDNGGKVIVSENHIGSGFGNSGTGSHGDTDFGFLQSWGIIDTITSHGGDVTVGLKVGNNLGFVGWFDSGEQFSVQASLELLVLVQFVEFSSGVSFSFSVFVIIEHSNSSADSDGGVLVITSDDNDSDTGSVTLFDGIKNFHSWWIEHTYDTQKGQVLFVVSKFGGVSQVHLGVWDWGVVDSQSQAPKSISTGSVFEDQSFNLGFHLGGQSNSFGTNSNFGTSFKDSLGGTFNEKFRFTGGFVVSVNGHGFSVSGEFQSVSFFVHGFDLGVDGGAFLGGGQRAHVFTEDIDFLDQNGQSGFGGFTDLLVNTFGGVEIDGRVVAQSADDRELFQVRVIFTLGWGVVGIVEGTLWLVSGTGHRVLGHVEGTGGDRFDGEHFADGHLVGGQSTGFIGTDDTGATESLDGWERPDDAVFLGHSVGTESEAGGDDGWKTFWDGGDGKSDGDLEVVDCTFDHGATVHWVVEVSDVDSPNENANDGDHFGQLFAKFVKFLGQWSLFSLGFNHGFSDFTDFGALTGLGDNTDTFS
jgi:hypothetical protein